MAARRHYLNWTAGKVCGLGAACLVVGLASLAGAQDTPIYGKTNMENPEAPLLVDLVHTPDPELVLTDVQGRINVYNMATAEALYGATLTGGALTAPVYGDFNGDNALELAVGTNSGDVVLLRGADLEIVQSLRVEGRSFTMQPTLVPFVQADGMRRDILVMLGKGGTLIALQMNEEGALQVLWEAATSMTPSAPLTIGNIRSTDRPEIVAGTMDGRLWVVDALEGTSRLPALNELVRMDLDVVGTPLIVDRNFNSYDEIIVAMSNGQIRCYIYDPNKNELIDDPSWTPATVNTPVASPVLVMSGNNINTAFVLQATENSLELISAMSGQSIGRSSAGMSNINTELALIPSPTGYPEVAFGQGQTIQISSGMDGWIMREASERLGTAEVALRHNLSSTIVVGVASETERATVVGSTVEDGGFLYTFETELLVPQRTWQSRAPWQTTGGSPIHNPRLDRDFARLEHDRQQRLLRQVEAWNAELQAAMDGGEWEEATRLAGNLASYDPLNADYRSLTHKVALQRYMLTILGSGAALLALLGFTAFKTMQIMGRRSLRRRAEAAASRGDYDEARRYYTRLAAKVPRSIPVAYALAKVFIAQRDYSAEALHVFARAYRAHQDDQELLHAYARALLVEPATTAEARTVYERSLPTFPEPQWLEYGMGRCDLAAGHYDEAGKRLRSALRGGVTSESLYKSLCEVYLQTKNFTAKALPVFEQQFPSRREDKGFLQAYLLACVDAKKTDQKVESLCQDVLELVPDFIPAYLHLASILLQKNQVGQAVEEVQQALKINPEDQQALTLLSQCYLIQNRKDEEALQAYRRALRANPTEKETLRMLAQIFYEKGQYDQEAINTYHASHQQSPNDVVTLKALAQTAQLANDADLTIKAVEALSNLGQTNQKLIQQLAAAYVKKGVTDPKAERTLREALRLEPNNVEYLQALANVYCAQDRDDVDCIAIFESHLQNFKEDVVIGRQLAKCYIKANRYEKALATTKRFLAVVPDDEELQRLNALASLYDNKLDEAVAEYQRLLERNPEDADAMVNLALAYGQKLRTDQEAVDLYHRALKLQPGNDMLHLAMARVHVHQGAVASAVDSYKEALKARENNEQNVIAHMTAVLSEHPEALRLRWFMVETLVTTNYFREALEQIAYISENYEGQTNNVLKALETILRSDTNNVTALVAQGRALLRAGKTTDASKALEKAHKLQPAEPDIQEALVEALQAQLAEKEDPNVRFRLGKVFFAQQEYDNAIGCFQQTAQDYRWEAESTKMLGRCFTGKGMLDLALQEFKKLVVDDETKELLYDLAQRYEGKRDLVGAKTVYRQLFAADISYKDVKQRFEMLSGSTSDPMAFEKTSIVQQMSEEAARRYELLDELGRGAMGIVYRARDKELDEIVALKILPDNMSNNPEAVRRFKIEARNARKLSHPAIVRIHDIGEEMGRKYISMEYVDGSDLKKKIKSAPDFRIPIREAIKFSMDIADALGYAHRLGIVHRDIKPANIMLTSKDEVKVTDFGIAKLLDADGAMGEGTMIGAVIGTPLYMSPEQVQGIPVDNRADIYSFGIMFYELLNGRPPFTEGDLAYQHIHQEPAPLSHVPADLWQIVARCLAKKKEDRWEKAEDIYEALKELAKANKELMAT